MKKFLETALLSLIFGFLAACILDAFGQFIAHKSIDVITSASAAEKLIFGFLAAAMAISYFLLATRHEEVYYDDDEDDDELDDDEDIEVTEITCTNKNPRPIINEIADIFEWAPLKPTLDNLDKKYEYAADVEDKTILDMQNEEAALRSRLIGCVNQILSEDFDNWSEMDRRLFCRQAFNMLNYHASLFIRCNRFGAIRAIESEDDEKKD